MKVHIVQEVVGDTAECPVLFETETEAAKHIINLATDNGCPSKGSEVTLTDVEFAEAVIDYFSDDLDYQIYWWVYEEIKNFSIY